MDSGNIYFIKNGKVLSFKLEYDKEFILSKLENRFDDYYSTAISNEEKEFSRDYNSDDAMMIYRNFLDEGYSVVRIAPLFHFSLNEEEKIQNSNNYHVDVMVSLNVGFEDASILQEVVEKLEENGYTKGHSAIYLRNEHINMFQNKDYDLWISNHGAPCSSVLPYFLKEKLQTLNEEEKRVVSYYRNFDLDRMLLENEAQSFPLTNDNAGVIVVDKEEVYESTTKKLQHGEEFNTIFSNLGKEELILSCDFLWDKADVLENILIQVCFKEIIIWAPEVSKLNDYQKEYLKDLSYRLNDLNEQIKKRGDITPLQVFFYAGTTVIEDYSENQQTVSDFREFVDSGFDVDFKNKKEK